MRLKRFLTVLLTAIVALVVVQAAVAAWSMSSSGDGKAKALSMPAGSAPTKSVTNPIRYLGDIVIARGIARRQAREAGHCELTELRILALHGLLHLLGFDHERDNGRMRRLERRLLRKAGLRDGLIERTGASIPCSLS